MKYQGGVRLEEGEGKKNKVKGTHRDNVKITKGHETVSRSHQNLGGRVLRGEVRKP